MRHLFRKPYRVSHIKYDQPNDEPEEHLNGKIRVRIILFGLGYTIMTNAPSLEYQMPPTENPLDVDKTYTIDVLMYNALIKRVVAVEVHGGYHRKNRNQIAKTRWKDEAVQEFLKNNRQIILDGKKYDYQSWRFKAYEPDDLTGKYALKDIEIIKDLI